MRSTTLLQIACLIIAAWQGSPSAIAEDGRRACSKVWVVSESANFRLCQARNRTVAGLLERLEKRREELVTRWAKGNARTAWAPKCNVYVYESANSFQRGTRRSPEMLGFSSLEIGDGQVWSRRIDVRGDLGQEFNHVLEHEVVHVVLADLFRSFQIPRWLDEGIAVAEEHSLRKNRLDRQFLEAIELKRQAPLAEVFALSIFPADRERTDLLYSQSASVVQFLATRATADKLIEFAKSSHRDSPAAALREHFGFRNLQEADRAWMEWVQSNVEPAVVETGPFTLEPSAN